MRGLCTAEENASIFESRLGKEAGEADLHNFYTGYCEGKFASDIKGLGDSP